LAATERLSFFLLQLIPAHRAYCEPFGGAASLLFAKGPSEIEVYNDLNNNLVNLFMVVRDHPIQFLERIYLLLYSRQLFEKWSTEIVKNSGPADCIERAARFYYCLCNSFAGGGPGSGWAFERSVLRHHPLTWMNKTTRVLWIHERLRGVHVDHLDFRRFIANWDAPATFFYCDPPYFQTVNYRNVPTFSEKDHRDLAKLLAGSKAKWLLTVGDHKLMRELYSDFHVEPVGTQLALEKVEAKGTRRVLRHLIITNFDPAHMRPFVPPKSQSAFRPEQNKHASTYSAICPICPACCTCNSD